MTVGACTSLAPRPESLGSMHWAACTPVLGAVQVLSQYLQNTCTAGSVVETPPANAGDTGSIPGWGKISYATGQLNPRAAATEAHKP